MAEWQPVAGDISEKLVAAGLAILERDGLQALTVRTLATEVGTSTMSVYTHFGGMSGVIDAIVVEAFTRFADALLDVEPTDDPVADFFVQGGHYRRFALERPQRYQLMFGLASPASTAAYRTDLTSTGSATNRAEFAPSFDALRQAVARMIGAGRIRDDGETTVAGRLWSISHGAVLLEMAGYFGSEGRGLTEILAPLTVDTLVGLGDDRDRCQASMRAAAQVLFGS
ncbi:WHG domain-containing protein [Mycobacterium sp. MYCO198283]|uniref:TetR/AcrR family transcriptional regulator n=1 Tax=Mycobacterium sp. MYCO198283 TaxID=2883505 RepID=UPI001E36A054|nr:WHG domain-containing protein [Mycobacterium sp. MYCO198283]MCG5432412.1 WHG domain-containing protein [Mycobacterium sp. MYCO198283]